MDSSDFANWQEELVMRSTTATNVYFVRAVLIEVDGDTDAAIEYIISLTSDGELEESFQNEFAYEHGIFPPGGFGDMNPEAFLEDNTTSDLGFDPALLKFAADVDPSELMSLEDVSTASTSTATSSNSTQVKNNESTVATTESSISSPEQHTAPGQFRRDSSPSSPSRQKPHQEHQAATKVKGTKKHSHGSPASSSSEASSAVHPKLAKFQCVQQFLLSFCQALNTH